VKEIRLSASSLKNYLLQLFSSFGIEENQSQSIAKNMIWSELIGRNNFGVNRIAIHLKRLEHKVLNPTSKPEFNQTSPGAGLLDGNNGFGYYVGELAMDKAIELATKNGIGIVGVNHSNFYGTGAYFVNQAAAQGMISLSLSNSFPKVVAHGGLSAVLGTNPFAFGVPRKNNEHLLIDFATSSLAGSTVREHLENGTDLPVGLAISPDGKPVTDPSKIGDSALLPFGGAKGYGLSLMVEILAGVLTGAGFSNQVKSTYSNFKQKSDSGHCMIAINIKQFMAMDEFYSRFETLVALLKASNVKNDVLLPGEVRWKNFDRNSKDGLLISPRIVSELETISERYGVTVPWNSSG
jgi:ureidoglycolate dehydrogenase (NAD+)